MRKCLILYTMLISTSIYSSTIPIGDKFYKVLFAKEALEPLLDADSNWQYIAKFEHAAKTIELPEALSTYNDLANNQKVPDVLRELAQYLEVMNSLDFNVKEENISNLKFATIYPYSSKEAIAIVKINNNDIQGAVEILQSLLNDIKCPTLIKINAQELLQIYDSNSS